MAPLGLEHSLQYRRGVPPVVNEELGIRQGVVNATTSVAGALQAAGVQSIVFAGSRTRVEVLTQYLREMRGGLAGFGRELLEHDDDAALGLVVLHADRPDVPGEGQRRDRAVAVGGFHVGREVLQQRQQVLAQGGDLLLLAPQVDEAALVTAGEEEHALPRRAVRTRPEHLGAREVVGLAHVHDGTRGTESPVSLTVRTAGPSSP